MQETRNTRRPFGGASHGLITIVSMFDRIWWFVTGVLAGGVVTVRALRRAPQPGDLRAAAAHTTADLLSLTAKVVRPPRRVRVVR